MAPSVQEVDDHPERPAFSPSEKMFACSLKLQGKKYPSITKHFRNKYRKGAPTRQGINKMMRNLNIRYTTLDCRKGRSGRKFTARTPANIAAVKRSLERAASRKPGQIGPSSRRHNENISRASYNRITKKDLKLKPYKIMRLHKVTPQQTVARLKMGRLLFRQPLAWFRELCVSDEAWFTLSGHVYNRQNTVCYSPVGNGTPDQWKTEASQGQKKVMVFCLLHGSGRKFGPFFIDGRVNQHTYRELLERKVFPLMKQQLGLARFRRTIWQQDGAKPHQARMVMEWLDSIFMDRMLAIKSMRGDSWAPYSPDCNPCDFFLWGYLKEKVYQPLPLTIASLKRKIKTEFERIPELMVSNAVLSMKKRGELMVQVEGKQFEGRREE